MKEIDEMDISLENCLDFFKFVQKDLRVPLKQLVLIRSLVTVSRCLTGNPFTELELEIIRKFLGGMLNENPQHVSPAMLGC